jgi:hypothetical protein
MGSGGANGSMSKVGLDFFSNIRKLGKVDIV